jgi:hypothetical protein
MTDIEFQKRALDEWAKAPTYSPLPARGKLLAPVRKLLLEEPAPPDGLENSLVPLRWLIQRAGAGIPLDQEAMPATDVIDDACEHFGWTRFDYLSGKRNICPQLWFFYKIAYRLRAITVRDGVVLQTPGSNRFLENDRDLWEGLCLQLTNDDSDFGKVIELFLGALLQDGTTDDMTLENRFNAALQEALQLNDDLVDALPYLSRCWNFAEIFVVAGHALSWFDDLDRCFPKLSAVGEATARFTLRAHGVYRGRFRYLHDLESALMPDGPALRPGGLMGPDEAWWEPLEAVLPFEKCHGFMYMYNDGKIHHYKHFETRNYLHLDEKGTAYRFLGERLGYERIPLEKAIALAFE